MSQRPSFRRRIFSAVHFLAILALSSTGMSITKESIMTSVSDCPIAAIAVGVCPSGEVLKTLTSTSTMVRTLPKATTTNHVLATPTVENSFSEPVTMVFIQTQYIEYMTVITCWSPVMIPACVGPSTTTSPSSTLAISVTAGLISGVTELAAVTEAAPSSKPNNDRSLIIIATVGGVVCAIFLFVCFYLYRRYHKGHETPRISHLDTLHPSNELVDMPYSPKTAASESATDLSSLTMKDYVGSFPSISQRHLPQIAEHGISHTDYEKSDTPVTRWSEIIRGGDPIDAIPTSDVFIDPHNSLPPSEISGRLYGPWARRRSSYQSRGSSAFLPPDGWLNVDVPGSPSEHEHELSILSPQPRTPIHPQREFSPSIYSNHTIPPSSQIPQWDPGKSRAISPSVYSQPASQYLERTPSRAAAWDETIRRLEGGGKGLTVSGDEGLRRRSPARKEDEESDYGDYETVMYESDAESRIETQKERERETWEMKGGAKDDIRMSTQYRCGIEEDCQ